jgi:hypothetical protein
VFFWAVGVLHSAARARSFPLTSEGQLHAETEAAHTLLDLRNLLRAMDWGLARLPADHPVFAELEDFHTRFAGVVAARDALEHFDEYSAGNGRHQRANPGQWHFDVLRETPEDVVVQIGPHSLDLGELLDYTTHFTGMVSAALDPQPHVGNVYADWYRARGVPLLDE